jgi:lauroyl/myristoyl acyltransferase
LAPELQPRRAITASGRGCAAAPGLLLVGIQVLRATKVAIVTFVLLRQRLQLAAVARRLVPRFAVPGVVALRLALAQRNPRRMANARKHMTFLIERSGIAHDIDAAAVRYLQWEIWRREARWHPSMFPVQPVRGMENLLDAQHRSGGVVISGMHLGPYESSLYSISAAGATEVEGLISPRCFVDKPKPADRQYRKLMGRGVKVHDASIGVAGIVRLLDAGSTLFIFCDVPGSVPRQFAGQIVRGASGLAVAAISTSSLVVPAVHVKDEQGWYIRLLPALDPCDFDSPQALLQALASIHEPHVLAHPEAQLSPLNRWTIPADNSMVEGLP